MRSLCISLDRRPDRWARFRAAAAAAGLPDVERLSAVDASTFAQPVHRHPALSVGTAHHILFGVRRSPYEIDRIGAVGATLSHIAAWKSLLAGSDEALIVFEDDCILPADFGAGLKAVIADLPTAGAWDVIQFHRTTFDGGRVSDCVREKAGSPWHTCTSLTGAHAYAVSRAGATKLLQRALPVELHVDAYMAFMSRLGEIRMLWHPGLDVPQPAGTDSDIGHGATTLVGVPTQMEESGLVVVSVGTLLGVVAGAAVVGGVVALVATTVFERE